MKNPHYQDGLALLVQTKHHVFVVDAADKELIAPYRWFTFSPKKRPYVKARDPRTGREVLLHRLLMNPPPELVVDHINHDTLDNRRANLRVVTVLKNNLNLQGAKKHSKTGILNVSAARVTGGRTYWVVRIHRGKTEKSYCKYFPYTREGLESATVHAAEKRREFGISSSTLPPTRYATRVSSAPKADSRKRLPAD